MPVFLNAILYAAGTDRPQKLACVDLLRHIAAGEVDAITSSPLAGSQNRIATWAPRPVGSTTRSPACRRLPR
jgi:hypothetical protein